MRLFVAIDLPDVIKDELDTLRTNVPGATWAKRQAFHLTLRFLGDQIAPERLNPIMSALDTVRAASFEMLLQGVGRFPPAMRGAARVLWVGIAPQPALADLHARIEQALATVGFPREVGNFSPHITLARLKTSNPTRDINMLLERHAAFQAGPVRVNEFSLFSSVLTAQGSRYKSEAVYRLHG
jgi:RNA 2',3'-cyclic 3'-phosphodiesterase